LLNENVLQVVRNFLKLVDGPKEGEGEAAGRIQSELEQYRRGLFRLVVVGEIKKGKSSFINALLGEPYPLPVVSDVATSTVFKVTYGDTRKYKVFFYPKNPDEPDERTDTLEITHEQVVDYGTEDKNPRNEKGVDFIGVKLPHPLLKSGVMIIDTPGLGGLFREHSEITWRYVPNADAIFFVFDSVEAVASKDEMEYLKKLRKMTPFLFFVQARIDLVSTEQ
jgi:predicted GTPase